MSGNAAMNGNATRDGQNSQIVEIKASNIPTLVYNWTHKVQGFPNDEEVQKLQDALIEQQDALDEQQNALDEQGHIAASNVTILQGFIGKHLTQLEQSAKFTKLVKRSANVLKTKARIDTVDRKINLFGLAMLGKARLDYVTQQLDATSGTLRGIPTGRASLTPKCSLLNCLRYLTDREFLSLVNHKLITRLKNLALGKPSRYKAIGYGSSNRFLKPVEIGEISKALQDRKKSASTKLYTEEELQKLDNEVNQWRADSDGSVMVANGVLLRQTDMKNHLRLYFVDQNNLGFVVPRPPEEGPKLYLPASQNQESLSSGSQGPASVNHNSPQVSYSFHFEGQADTAPYEDPLVVTEGDTPEVASAVASSPIENPDVQLFNTVIGPTEGDTNTPPRNPSLGHSMTTRGRSVLSRPPPIDDDPMDLDELSGNQQSGTELPLSTTRARRPPRYHGNLPRRRTIKTTGFEVDRPISCPNAEDPPVRQGNSPSGLSYQSQETTLSAPKINDSDSLVQDVSARLSHLLPSAIVQDRQEGHEQGVTAEVCAKSINAKGEPIIVYLPFPSWEPVGSDHMLLDHLICRSKQMSIYDAEIEIGQLLTRSIIATVDADNLVFYDALADTIIRVKSGMLKITAHPPARNQTGAPTATESQVLNVTAGTSILIPADMRHEAHAENSICYFVERLTWNYRTLLKSVSSMGSMGSIPSDESVDSRIRPRLPKFARLLLEYIEEDKGAEVPRFTKGDIDGATPVLQRWLDLTNREQTHRSVHADALPGFVASSCCVKQSNISGEFGI